MAKKIDPAAKAKRQKVIAGVLGAVLLAVLAFQGPRTLKMLHQSSASASPPATPAATGATGTTGATGVLASSASGGDGVNDPGVLPAPQSGQLLGFSRFRTKDPFSQQINTNCTSGDCGSGSATQAPSAAAATKATQPKPAAAPKTNAPTAPAAKPTSAEISVNGATEKVAVDGKFPASNPTFVLVSLTKSTAKVGIAGGSLEGSKQTVTLRKGVPLTLMNTADGMRYVLRLVSVG